MIVKVHTGFPIGVPVGHGLIHGDDGNTEQFNVNEIEQQWLD